MYIEKTKEEEKPHNAIGEANLINGDFWIIEEANDQKLTTQEETITLLKEIRDLLKNKDAVVKND